MMCLLLAAFAACCLPACGKQEKQTLRDAEELAQDWLASLGKLLAPVKPDLKKPDGKSASKKQADEEDEEESSEWPATLRDCFVDDGWDPQGFKNPTEAVVWLGEDKYRVGKVRSIERVEGGAVIIFELTGKKKIQVEACIVLENDYPKCKWLGHSPF